MTCNQDLCAYRLYWSPEGKPIAVVYALSEQEAVKKTPMPWKQYLGEVYAEQITNSKE